jgi:hypothetical protein
MATLETAKRKYARKVPVMASNYQAGMEHFFGRGAGSLSSAGPVLNYKDVIKSGVEDKYARNLAAAFGI